MAVRIATAARLTNAATCEFLRTEDGAFHFLEVNTRLQVEHGVTELVTGVDIVREQLLLAAGRPLSDEALAAAEAAAVPERHAIEVRISAEDPGRAFAPTPGTIGRWELPSGPGIRVDTAVGPGTRVPPDYDPLIAKLMVVDETREAAIDRLARALEETTITGIQTTLPFHRYIAGDAGFRAADLSVAWVDDHWAAIADEQRRAALEIAARVAATAAGAVMGASAAVGATGSRGADTAGSPAPPAGSSNWARAGRAQAIVRRPR
jgi:acetyl-CoA carboxylase biotin carboxylase subunit